MFSHDEKLKAVLLYVKNGLRAAPTIRALGYPSRKMLKRWHMVYASTGDVPNHRRRRPKFSEEQQTVAVDHYLEHGRCLAFTARELGYPNRETLRQWVHERSPGIRKASIQRGRPEPFSEDEKRQAVIDL